MFNTNKMFNMRKTIVVIALFCLYNCNAFNYELNSLRLNDPLRNRKLDSVNIYKISCEKDNNGKCICPGNCFTFDNSTKKCYAIDCWKWNSIEAKCEKAGKEWLPAIILQGIPLTGVFGSGFGNIDRWDIFGMYMGIVFGSCVFICIINCCCLVFNNAEDKEAIGKVTTSCFTCIWAVVILAFWIWGIVVIANREVDAPWTSWDGNSIMCPLI